MFTRGLRLGRLQPQHHSLGVPLTLTRAFRASPAIYNRLPVLHPNRINKGVVQAEYAVRGQLVLTAEELQQKLKEPDHNLPFDEIIFCNIGNPQSVGQKPLTFPRQVLSLCLNSDLLAEENLEQTRKMFPEDAIARAQHALLQTAGGFGAYSHSMGLPWLRKSIANFIQERDGGVPSDPDNIFLTNGASEGVKAVLNLLLRDGRDGIMVPIPQYPLYSATISMLKGYQMEYYLDETKNWSTNDADLKRAVEDAAAHGVVPRALCVINPGNPTGQVLSLERMQSLIQFCVEHNIVLMADEVYQANTYTADKPFHSFKKVLAGMGPGYSDKLELISFHSTSKGFLGECGMRGGYMELVNIHPEAKDQLYKLASVSLCSNLPGQLMTELMVNPPKEGDASYNNYQDEYQGIVESLGRRARKCAEAFNELEGMSCNAAEGAMYLFPRIRLPEGALLEAERRGIPPDTMYSLELLSSTGICVVPGSGFGQEEGTLHFRTTFLPPEDKMDTVIARMSKFHASFMDQYR